VPAPIALPRRTGVGPRSAPLTAILVDDVVIGNADHPHRAGGKGIPKPTRQIRLAIRRRHRKVGLIGLIPIGPLPSSFWWLPAEGIQGRLLALRLLFSQKSHQVRTRSSARLA
jgi:hypothetical protein